MSENSSNRTGWRNNRGNTVEENGPLMPSEHEELQLPKPAIITILPGLLMGIVVGILVCICLRCHRHIINDHNHSAAHNPYRQPLIVRGEIIYREISDNGSYASSTASSQKESADKDTLCRQASY